LYGLLRSVIEKRSEAIRPLDAIGIVFVIPAQAGIQEGPSGPLKNHSYSGRSRFWIPAFAGMTKRRTRPLPREVSPEKNPLPHGRGSLKRGGNGDEKINLIPGPDCFVEDSSQ